MAKIDAIDVPKLIFPEAAAPSTPASGKVITYAKSDGLMYSKDDAGTETVMSGGGGGGGSLVLLESHTGAASATLDFTTFISSTYDDYMFEGVGVRPATDGTNLLVRVGTGGGPTYDSAANYYGTVRANGSSAGTAVQTDAGATAMMLAKVVDNDSTFGHASFSMRLTQPQSTGKMKQLYGNVCWHNGTEFMMGLVGYLYGATTALTAIRFLMASGNITDGEIRVYGIAKT